MMLLWKFELNYTVYLQNLIHDPLYVYFLSELF